eukprot:Hpha_TRINITY_DN18413_c0_g1::TRINITY_DN18413_c0_g1_i1::g.165513::m.165513
MFDPHVLPTCGTESMARWQLGLGTPVMLYDTAGDARYRSVALAVCRGTTGLILAVDVQEGSLGEVIEIWQALELSSEGTRVLLLGCKAESGCERAVRSHELSALAEERGWLWAECSAKCNEGVEGAHMLLINAILTRTAPQAPAGTFPASERASASCCVVS